MNEIICPKCKEKLARIQLNIDLDDKFTYTLECCWCNYKSDKYDDKEEVIKNEITIF